MSNYVFDVPTWTPVAVADAAAMTNAGFTALQGGTSTQRNKIKKVFIGGLATASAPVIMLLARDSTVGATLTALASPNSNAAQAAAAIAPTAVGFVAATTPPQRSNSVTVSKLGVYPFNAWGGIAREEWAPGEEPDIVGNTASLGEVSLSAFTGTVGLLGTGLTYEQV